MGGAEEIRRLFERKLEEATRNTYYGEVESVDEKARTCTVLIEDIPYENVLLYAIEKPDLKGFVFIPAAGSKVLVERMGDDRYLIRMFSEVEKVVFTTGELSLTADGAEYLLQVEKTTVKATGKGLTFTNGSAGLKKTLSDLVDAILALTVPTGVGPSGTPINMAAFQSVKKELDNYLEG